MAKHGVCKQCNLPIILVNGDTWKHAHGGLVRHPAQPLQDAHAQAAQFAGDVVTGPAAKKAWATYEEKAAAIERAHWNHAKYVSAQKLLADAARYSALERAIVNMEWKELTALLKDARKGARFSDLIDELLIK